MEVVFFLGVIIFLGGGIGFVIGSKVIICMFGVWYMVRMLEVVEEFLINVGFLGKGNVFDKVLLIE